MSILITEQTVPVTPAANEVVQWPDMVLSSPFVKDAAGRAWGRSHRSSIANQTGFASDTYVTGSGILVPSFGVQAQTMFEWIMSVSKTAAGVAAPVYQLRVGGLQTTADVSLMSMTGPAQTAVADVGVLTILVTVRSVGAAGVFQAIAIWNHNAVITGFSVDDAGAIQGTSAGLNNSAFGGAFVGLSINGGASAAWTMTQVRANAIW